MAIGNLRQFFTKRRLRWAGLISSVLLIGTLAASGKYVAKGGFTLNTGGVDSASITISRGGLTLEYGRSLREPSYDKLIWVGWRTNETYGLMNQPRVWVSNPGGGLPNYGYLFIPLWIPIALIVPWTASRWWRERSPPPGLCRKCRYDLAGLSSAVCPECGTPALSESEAARVQARSRRVEAVLIGACSGGLAGWMARRFYFEGNSWLPVANGLIGGGFVAGVWGRHIHTHIRKFSRILVSWKS